MTPDPPPSPPLIRLIRTLKEAAAGGRGGIAYIHGLHQWSCPLPRPPPLPPLNALAGCWLTSMVYIFMVYRGWGRGVGGYQWPTAMVYMNVYMNDLQRVSDFFFTYSLSLFCLGE